MTNYRDLPGFRRRPTTPSASEEIRTRLRASERVLFLADQALGRLPRIALGESVRLKPVVLRELGILDDVFTISGPIVGANLDTFCRLTDAAGTTAARWFRVTELLPPTTTQTKETSMSSTNDATQKLMLRRDQLVAAGMDPSTATKQAAKENGTAAEQHRGFSGTPVVQTPINLHRRPDEGFSELVGRVQREQGVDHKAAIRIAQHAYPELARDYSSGDALQ